jgi:hypothetical protein
MSAARAPFERSTPKTPEEVAELLFHSRSTQLTSEEAKDVLELYKVYVDSMEKVVARRQTVHAFFITANAFLMTCAALLITKDFVQSGVAVVPVVVASLAGFLLSLVWMKLSRHYGLLNDGKFKVIHAFERCLPAAPYLTEWDVFERGENPEKFQSMSTIEWIIPVIFLVIYILMFVIGIVVFVMRIQAVIGAKV